MPELRLEDEKVSGHDAHCSAQKKVQSKNGHKCFQAAIYIKIIPK